MPPSQLVSPRQKKIPLPYTEKSLNTVAPVVVRPDIDSNSASTWPRPFHMYGRPANHAITNQASDTIARPSARRMRSTASSASGPPARRIKWPIAHVTTVHTPKPSASTYSR